MSNKVKLLILFAVIMLFITAIILHVLHLDDAVVVEGLELLFGILLVIGYIIFEIVKARKSKKNED